MTYNWWLTITRSLRCFRGQWAGGLVCYLNCVILQLLDPLIDDLQPPDFGTVEMFLDRREIDMIEIESVEEFCRSGYSCTYGRDGSPCCQLFTVQHYSEMRSWCAELTRSEKDLLMKGQIMALTLRTDTCMNTLQHRHTHASRQREYTTYFHQGLKGLWEDILFSA